MKALDAYADGSDLPSIPPPAERDEQIKWMKEQFQPLKQQLESFRTLVENTELRNLMNQIRRGERVEVLHEQGCHMGETTSGWAHFHVVFLFGESRCQAAERYMNIMQDAYTAKFDEQSLNIIRSAFVADFVLNYKKLRYRVEDEVKYAKNAAQELMRSRAHRSNDHSSIQTKCPPERYFQIQRAYDLLGRPKQKEVADYLSEKGRYTTPGTVSRC